MSPSLEESVNTYELSPDQRRILYETSTTLHDHDSALDVSKEALLEEHSRNLKLFNSSKPPIKEIVLPVAYSPSQTPLDSLEKISLKELKLETHHRGCFVTAKTITQPYQSIDLISVIEESDGHVAKLSLGFDFESIFGLRSNLPINSTVAIKEPYCKYNGKGDFVIRVDHPSDIAILRGDDPAVAMIMEFVAENKVISPQQWKKSGDKAYLEKNYTSAIECYTQAIDTAGSEDPAFVRDVHQKRGFANLTARYFKSAQEDALASCVGDKRDEKAFYCAGRAAYNLGLFEEAKGLFERALNLGPNDARYKTELDRTLARIEEEQIGAYDFKSMIASVSAHNMHLDHADYSAKIEVRDTPSHGRGLFTTQFVEAGSVVLCEKAFILSDLYSDDEATDLIMYNFNSGGRTHRPAQAALFLQLVQKVYKDSDLAARYFDLDGGAYIRSHKEGERIDGVPLVDTFLVEAIRLRNCFSCPRVSLELLKSRLTSSAESGLSTGLWTKAAYMNHSCVPNCVRSFIGDMMIIRATKDIPKDTELTQQYISHLAFYPERRDTIPKNWDFECDCTLCSSEKESSMERHEKRGKLVAQIKAEALKIKSYSRIPAGTRRRVEQLTKNLEDLHEPEVYKNIPRLLLAHPSIWLCEAYRWSKNYAKIIKYSLDILRNFGFIDPVRDGKLCLDGEHKIVNSEAFSALRAAAEGYSGLGMPDLARQCEAEAKKIFVMLTGTQEGLDEIFAQNNLMQGFDWSSR